MFIYDCTECGFTATRERKADECPVCGASLEFLTLD